MANKVLLHSGEFDDQNGGRIKVSFYKVYHLKVWPYQLRFDATGGVLLVSIWSTKGNARLSDNFPEWLNYRQERVEPLPGSLYYKYTYAITCSSNSGTSRSFNWVVNVEDGPEAGYASIHFNVYQKGASQSALSVSPNNLNMNGSGQTATVNFTNMSASGVSQEITYNESDTGWLNVSVSGNTGTVSVSRNESSSSRSATVTFRDNSNPENYANLRVEQGSTTLYVSPQSLRYPVGQSTNGITATWTAGNQPTITIEYETSDTGWLVQQGSGQVYENTISWGLQAQENTTLVERRARITVTNGIDSVIVEVMQNRQ